MRPPLQITFRHVDPSPSVEDRIREYAGELDRFFDQIELDPENETVG